MVQERKKLALDWKEQLVKRNEINEFSQNLLKHYNKLNDEVEAAELMNSQMEEKIIYFKQILKDQKLILEKREEILRKEENYVLESEKLLNSL